MKDSIGQEIKIGDYVVHVGCSKTAGVRLKKVLKITPKRVSVTMGYTWKKPSYLEPETILVVTGNLISNLGNLPEKVIDNLKDLNDWGENFDLVEMMTGDLD